MTFTFAECFSVVTENIYFPVHMVRGHNDSSLSRTVTLNFFPYITLMELHVDNDIDIMMTSRTATNEYFGVKYLSKYPIKYSTIPKVL